MPPATAPKKPLTAFFCFRRALAKAELSGAGVAAVAKLTGERWKALTPEERQIYDDEAAADKARFERESAEHAAQIHELGVDISGDDESVNAKGADAELKFPLSRIKRLAKLDPEVGTVTKEATHALALAAELFIGTLASEAAVVATASKRKTISDSDLLRVMHSSEPLAFLRLDFPLVPVSSALAAHRGGGPGQAGADDDDAKEEDADEAGDVEAGDGSGDARTLRRKRSGGGGGVLGAMFARAAAEAALRLPKPPPPEAEAEDDAGAAEGDDGPPAAAAGGLRAAGSKAGVRVAGKGSGGASRGRAKAHALVSSRSAAAGSVGIGMDAFVRRLNPAEAAAATAAAFRAIREDDGDGEGGGGGAGRRDDDDEEGNLAAIRARFGGGGGGRGGGRPSKRHRRLRDYSDEDEGTAPPAAARAAAAPARGRARVPAGAATAAAAAAESVDLVSSDDGGAGGVDRRVVPLPAPHGGAGARRGGAAGAAATQPHRKVQGSLVLRGPQPSAAAAMEDGEEIADEDSDGAPGLTMGQGHDSDE